MTEKNSWSASARRIVLGSGGAIGLFLTGYFAFQSMKAKETDLALRRESNDIAKAQVDAAERQAIAAEMQAASEGQSQRLTKINLILTALQQDQCDGAAFLMSELVNSAPRGEHLTLQVESWRSELVKCHARVRSAQAEPPVPSDRIAAEPAQVDADSGGPSIVSAVDDETTQVAEAAAPPADAVVGP